MRVSSYAVARPSYYDRNATSSLSSYAANLGPHADTTRWTVTVAAGKKSLVELGATYSRRITVATVAGEYGSYIQLTSGATNVYFPATATVSNVVDFTNSAQYSGSPTLYAGETIAGHTYDLCTGGIVNYTVAAKLTTFDT